MDKHQKRGLPFPVQRVIRKLGRDIRDARLRRRISTSIMAGRASISRTTLYKVEKGDSGVSLGIYTTVLFVLGLANRIGDLADVKTDTIGLELEEESLPQRIRRPKKSKPGLLIKKSDE
jgi:DNA-binding XRE family transcriptional regulator